MELNKILIKYMKRYFLGFLVVFMSSVLVAVVAQKSIENYIIDRSVIKNQEGINSINETISKMDLINQIISENKTFQEIVFQRGNIPRSDVLKLKAANQVITEIGVAANYIPYMFTIFKDNDLYLSSNHCSFSFDDYYQGLLEISSSEMDFSSANALRESLFSQFLSGNFFLQANQIRYNYNNKQYILQEPLLYLTSDNKSLDPKYMTCFVLDKESIARSIIMPELLDQSFLYIEDAQTGEALLQYGNVPKEAKTCDNGEIIRRNSYCTIVNIYQPLRWRIVTGIPVAYIKSQIRPVSELLVLYLCVGVLLVLCLTLYFSFKQYYNLKNLILFSDSSVSQNAAKGMDDYRLVTDNIIKLKKEGNDCRLQMEELAKQNKAIILKHLIINGAHSAQEYHVLEKYFEKIPENFCVAIVRYNQNHCENQEELTVALVEQIHERYDCPFINVYGSDTDELFLLKLQPGQMIESIYVMFEEVVAQITQEYGVTMHVGISTTETQVSSLGRCYEQARHIVQAQYAYLNENRVEKYDVAVNEMDKNMINLELLNRLNTLLICGQKEETLSLLKSIEQYYQERPYLYEMQKEQIFYSMKNVYDVVCINLNVEPGLLCKLEIHDEQMTCKYMFQKFKVSAVSICDYIYQMKKSKNEGLCQRIIDYVNQSYNNAGLSSYDVSREMGISEKYLSQFMKEQIGETFSTYLCQLRLEKAKEYLKTTDYTNDKIAELTGFGSVNTFYRNFSKYVGITPRIYKETYKKE